MMGVFIGHVVKIILLRMKHQASLYPYSWRSLARGLWFLWGMGHLQWQYARWLFFLFIVLGYSAVPPLILGKIVDFFAQYQPGQPLTIFYTYSIVLGVSMVVVALVRLSIKKRLGFLKVQSIYHIRVCGFETLMSQSLLGQYRKTAGEKAQQIQNGTDAFNTLLHLFTNQLLAGLSAAVGIIVVFLCLRPVYVLFFLMYIGVFIAILVFFQNKLHRLNMERNRALESASGTYIEGLGGLATVQASFAERAFLAQVEGREMISRTFANAIILITNRQWKIFQAFNGSAIGLFLLLVGREVSLGVIGVGSIVVLYSYLEKLIGSADQTLSLYNDLIQAKAGIGRLLKVLQLAPERNKGTRPFPDAWKELTVREGAFHFRECKELSAHKGLTDIHFTVKKGQCVAIVGRSGSGKTTLVRLLMGLYSWDSGAYRIDGVDVDAISTEEMARHFAMAVQDPEIFNASVLENMTLFKNVPSDTITKALEAAQLQGVIARLPEGLETKLGEKGQRLSHGERQRVNIARALCQPGEVLILDEATSALDGATQAAVMEALKRDFPEKTVIMIAHRPEVLKQTDFIYVLSNGRIVEQGMFEELSARSSSVFKKVLHLSD